MRDRSPTSTSVNPAGKSRNACTAPCTSTCGCWSVPMASSAMRMRRPLRFPRPRRPARPYTFRTSGTRGAGSWDRRTSGTCSPSAFQPSSRRAASACAASKLSFWVPPRILRLLRTQLLERGPAIIDQVRRAATLFLIQIRAAVRTQTTTLFLTQRELRYREHQMLTHGVRQVQLLASGGKRVHFLRLGFDLGDAVAKKPGNFLLDRNGHVFQAAAARQLSRTTECTPHDDILAGGLQPEPYQERLGRLDAGVFPEDGIGWQRRINREPPLLLEPAQIGFQHSCKRSPDCGKVSTDGEPLSGGWPPLRTGSLP